MANPDPLPALDRARRKAYLRLMPLIFLGYAIAYIDRTNVALAGANMQKALGFDNAVFGTGAGIFFIGYFLLEIPGSLIVERWSARKWIARIMVSWGIIASLTALVRTPGQFYTVRFILGLAEAGFFPGMIVFLTHWFPARDRARALSYLMIAAPLAQVASPKITNLFLGYGTDEVVNGVMVHVPKLMGLAGWQWVYVFWGIPAVVMGFVILFALPDRPRDAKWLSDDEKEALEQALLSEKAAHGASGHMPIGKALRNPFIIFLALAYFANITGNYGVEFFMPKILQTWYGLDRHELTWYVMIPYAGQILGILYVGRRSDRKQERWLHAAVPGTIGAFALVFVMTFDGSMALTIAGFTLALFGIRGFLGPFWALPSLMMTGSAAAASIGLINSVGNLGGFLGPYVLGQVEKATGSFKGGLAFLAVSLLVSSVMIALLGRWHKRTLRPAAQK